jgi:hypothetical protein
VVTPFLEIDFERDEVEPVAVGLSFLLLEVEEFDRCFGLSEPSDLLDLSDLLSTGMVVAGECDGVVLKLRIRSSAEVQAVRSRG